MYSWEMQRGGIMNTEIYTDLYELKELLDDSCEECCEDARDPDIDSVRCSNICQYMRMLVVVWVNLLKFQMNSMKKLKK